MIRPILLAAALAAITTASPALAASAFGCKHLEDNPTMPAVEGKDGFFFRVFADLRMQHPLTEQVAAEMGQLSEALKAHGTTLIYLPVPTKSVTMPTFLPAEAALFGFDEKIATFVYDDQIARLQAAGVMAVDLLSALKSDDSDKPPFFRSDFHWTADGARRAAEAVGARIKAMPDYAEVTPVQFETKAVGADLAVSGMRRELQAYCVLNLPPVISTLYDTVEVASADSNLDIFGDSAPVDGAASDEVVLVGTSFSDSVGPNFSGFLAQYTNMQVSNMAITGGNQFGAVTSYMTSRDFETKRPRYMVWENPIYNNLAQYGTGPMLELIAAARNECQPLDKITKDPAKGTLEADLTGQKIGADRMLLADAGDEGSRDVVVEFTSTDGRTFEREIHRGDRFRATGRFYLPFDNLDSFELAKVSIKFDRLSSDTASVSLCSV